MYQRLSCCLRSGTAVPEHTLLDPAFNPNPNPNHNTTSDAPTSPDNDCDTPQPTDYPVNIMHSKPSSDHSLAYLLLEEGHIVVAIANADSELLATFPATVSLGEYISNYLTNYLTNK